MLRRVPATAAVVLDVGCGAGAFGAGLKREWQSQGRPLTVWGLELDPVAGARAADVLDRVLIGDAAALLPGLPEAGFDAVILNDILEHLVEPAELLARLRPLLRPGGHVVCSLPNVRHFPNVVNLVVHGSWRYTDEGILDRTHLRFFTRSSMIALLTDCGYVVESVEGINPTGSLKFKLLNLLTLGNWADMRYLQFALRARVAGETS
jgi:2-polyprenyl-3-methyl-5-hydroxy-6-metoxy-1,4-benzoquinol methylase